MRWRDLTGEAVAGLFARPARAALTALGTVLGIAALVATLGISRTAGNQIVGRFDALAATEVVVEPATGFGVDVSQSRGGASLPWNVEDRLDRLNGVRASGALADVSKAPPARPTPVRDPTRPNQLQLRVVAATPGLLEAIRGRMVAGRWFDEGHSQRADRVVVLGANAAQRLGVVRIDDQPAVLLGDRAYVVVGILEGAAREGDLVDAIILPRGTARADFGDIAPSRVVIDTAVGAAHLIATQAPVALNPNDPGALRVGAPSDPKAVKRKVERDVQALFVLLGLVSLVIGAIGIANTTLVTVLERVGEIGLRRALGAARRHIAGQFLLESMVTGFAGGVVGASVGVLVVVVVAAARGWTPLMAAWVALVAPIAGALVGLLAGMYPAWRAARLEPVEALRSGV